MREDKKLWREGGREVIEKKRMGERREEGREIRERKKMGGRRRGNKNKIIIGAMPFAPR